MDSYIRTAERERDANRVTQRVLSGFMLLFLAVGLLLSLFSGATWRAPRGEAVLNGDWSAAYEANFEEGLLLRKPAEIVWNGLKFRVFGEGLDGVLVGSSPWLFSSEEFSAPEAGALATNLDYITSVQQYLAQRDVDLVVALVPAKARMFEAQLGRYRLPDTVQRRYSELLGALEQRSVPVADLLPTLSNEATFFKTDTHWTPHGAALAAEAIAELVRGRPFAGLGDSIFETTLTGREELTGDLLNFVPLGGLEPRFGLEPETLERFETRSQGSADLFASPDIPVTLVGSSYSADERWHFAGALKTALGADVLNAAEVAQGPFRPMATYLDAAFAQDPPELIIWELPERYLTTRYELSDPATNTPATPSPATTPTTTE